MEYILLRFCLSLPKFLFILRTCPLSFIQEAVEALDTALCDAVTEFVDAALSN